MFDRLKQGLKGIVDRISKTGLSEKDLEPLTMDLQIQLISNDVSVQVVEHICDELKKRLIGQETSRFGDRFKLVRDALKESIESVMQTDKKIDLIKAISDAKNIGQSYIIMFVGINGTWRLRPQALHRFCLRHGDRTPVDAAQQDH